MATRQSLSKLQLLPEDHRSEGVWLLLLVLGLFVTVVSWLDWVF